MALCARVPRQLPRLANVAVVHGARSGVEEIEKMRAGHRVKAAAAAIVAVVLMGLSLSGGPAGAQGEDDYADVLNTTVDRTTVGNSCNNADITVTTSGLLPGSEATFTLYSDPVVLGTAVADAEGNATLVFDLPAGTTIGRHEIVTSGTNANGVPEEETIVLNVTSCAPSPGGPGSSGGGTGGTGATGGTGGDSLARTGTDVSMPVRAAVVVFAAGAALLLVSRKRQVRSA